MKIRHLSRSMANHYIETFVSDKYSARINATQCRNSCGMNDRRRLPNGATEDPAALGRVRIRPVAIGPPAGTQKECFMGTVFSSIIFHLDIFNSGMVANEACPSLHPEA